MLMTSSSVMAATYIYSAPTSNLSAPVKVGEFEETPSASNIPEAMRISPDHYLGYVVEGESTVKVLSFKHSIQGATVSGIKTLSGGDGFNPVIATVSCTPPGTLSSAVSDEICDLIITYYGDVPTYEPVYFNVSVTGSVSSSEYVNQTFSFSVQVGGDEVPVDPEPLVPNLVIQKTAQDAVVSALEVGTYDKYTSAAPSRLVTVTNTGNGPANNVSVETNEEITRFVISNNTCMNIIAAGSSCSFNVTFTPRPADEVDSYYSSVAVSYRDADNNVLVESSAMVGYVVDSTPLVANLDLFNTSNGTINGSNPTNVGTFDKHALVSANPYTFVLKNTGNSSATNVSVAVADTSKFAIESNTCGVAGTPVTIPKDATCSVTVKVTGTAASVVGTYNSVLNVTYNSPSQGTKSNFANVTGQVIDTTPQGTLSSDTQSVTFMAENNGCCWFDKTTMIAISNSSSQAVPVTVTYAGKSLQEVRQYYEWESYPIAPNVTYDYFPSELNTLYYATAWMISATPDGQTETPNCANAIPANGTCHYHVQGGGAGGANMLHTTSFKVTAATQTIDIPVTIASPPDANTWDRVYISGDLNFGTLPSTTVATGSTIAFKDITIHNNSQQFYFLSYADEYVNNYNSGRRVLKGMKDATPDVLNLTTQYASAVQAGGYYGFNSNWTMRFTALDSSTDQCDLSGTPALLLDTKVAFGSNNFNNLGVYAVAPGQSCRIRVSIVATGPGPYTTAAPNSALLASRFRTGFQPLAAGQAERGLLQFEYNPTVVLPYTLNF